MCEIPHLHLLSLSVSEVNGRVTKKKRRLLVREKDGEKSDKTIRQKNSLFDLDSTRRIEYLKNCSAFGVAWHSCA